MGWVERLNAEDNEGMYLMIEVRPEEYKDELGSDITLNRRDMKSMFGYIMLGETQLLKQNSEVKKWHGNHPKGWMSI
ncbi:MAG: hypothetical protein C5S33_01545 [ANME-2 cluster archaeon]|nr:hypothetical protein [ANME-2 cluster archaeon]